MAYYIKVQNIENSLVWESNLTEQEFNKVKNWGAGHRTASIVAATVIPVRTNNLKNFSKDFFLPTTINHAVKVQNIVDKIFAVLAALPLDVLTFPVRLLTCIPRIISNTKQEEHLLRQYLINQNVDKKILENDHVRVTFMREEYSEELQVNFIEQPIYRGSDHFKQS